MYVSRLTLNNFRNYENQQIEFSPETNLIYGNNAQGKTNILEAVYLFATGRSHRAKSDRELIRFDSDFAKISIDFHDSDRDYNSVMTFSKNGKKSIRINGVPIKKLSQLMSYLNAVMFSPEDLSLVKGSPSARRRFCDSAISQLHAGYMSHLSDYGKILMQKNSLLKTLKKKGAKSDPMLSVWNEQLAEHGYKIMQYRLDFINELSVFVSGIQKEISGESLQIEYAPSVKTSDITKEAFLGYIQERQNREIDFASACCGIQRDDIIISINGNDAKLFGSQGQQRTAALAMKIALGDYMYNKKGEYPVLLLDDIMSELDINRRLYLSQKIRDKQVLITSTDTDIAQNTDSTKLFRIDGGKIFNG